MSERESAWEDIGGSSGKDPIERGKFAEHARRLEEALKDRAQEERAIIQDPAPETTEATQSIEESRRKIHEILDRINSETDS